MSGQAKIEYLEASERQLMRAYSPAISVRGGRTIYLAGQTAAVALDGRSLLGDFEGQARTVFGLLDATLKRVGGSLHNMVTMTVFINDQRYGDRLTELRKEFFPKDRFPCSALITVTGFALPGIVIEIQGIAVIDD